ncbi:glycosyltransferase [Granulosicoccus sp. 3-233]|uniref:glycosyltransferase n=1 Tax=Granulosicoccus sp. 3-233 TaxID=3417969 RepID=UPI003D342253
MTQPAAQSCDLSVIIPTYNESENIQLLLGRLADVLNGIDYEIIVVDDDSPDLTWKVVEQLGLKDKRVQVIRRLDRKGLSSAVTTGMLESRGNCLAVMDADLQHDETILPTMFKRIAGEDYDICVGSREAEGGGYGDWSANRKLVSSGARWLANVMMGELVLDPMSGYFAVSRHYFQQTIDKVNPQGFKILLEFLARGESPRVCEVGYEFRNRIHGETKLNASVALEYLLALVDLRFGWLVPNQFVKFGLVGISGSLVNFFGFALAQGLGMSIPLAVVLGVELAIVWTYFANNFFTFTPMTFRGRNFFMGLLLYQLVCCYGLVVQLSVVQMLLTNFPFMREGLATLYLVYMVGVAFAAVGNYFLHSYYTWNRLGFSLSKPSKSAPVAIV